MANVSVFLVHQPLEKLEEVAQRYRGMDLELAVAYISPGGVLNLSQLIKAARCTRITVGLAPINRVVAFRQLQELGAEVFVYLAEPGSIFHPKVYYGVNKGLAWAMIGSSNLTSSGLGLNIELNLLIEGQRFTEPFTRLEALLEGYRLQAHPLTEELYRSLEAAEQRLERHIREREYTDYLRREGIPSAARPALVVPEPLQRQALEELDAFLGRFLPALARGELRLFLASPLPTGEAIERNATLTFFILAGDGVTPGVLTSPTTRRWGIVANTDVAPSILEWLGIEPPLEMTGRPVRALAAERPVEQLEGLERIFTELNAERPGVLKTYVALQILAILLSIAVFLLTPRIPARAIRGLQLAILALTTVPLAFLLLGPLFSPALFLNLVALLALVALLTALASLAARYWRTPLAAFFLVYAATAGLLLADGLTGAHLIQRSFLGYDPIGGARFYGVGNEYMGVLIGAAIMSATLGAELWPALQRHALAVTAGLGGVVILLLAAPQLGANVGGTIAAVAGFTWTAMALHRRRLDWRWPLAGGILLLLLLALAALYDATLAQGAASHLGRTWELIQGKGVQELWVIAVRKLKMNLKLMRYTIWSRVLVAFIASGIVLCYRPVGLLRKVMRRHTLLTVGLWGCLAGGVAAFVANDSGVVAAATLMLYPTAVFLHLILAHLGEKSA
ncbi:MAG: hypothetical protein IMW90_08795 [Thermogemmatispora sp.]|uniref:phospholipase D-like domain-containing protein n=1 Tax=Thermogemmatispora sp. TaxID=1968838 RepID=UPI001A0000FE|nr:phospholipase D-like domain-containing protein [Thermogemmatispora sp.]MBE3565809.1 hypothetical protein [Thermogemmatispora sp.]